MKALNFLNKYNRQALSIAIIALLLRLLFILVIDTSPDYSGGDTNWYMQYGRALVTTGTTAGPVQTPPLYLVFVGSIQAIVPSHPDSGEYYIYTEMQIARVLQAIMSAGLCLFVYSIARSLFSERAGLLAAGFLAVSPALVIESGLLLSETLFLFFLFGGFALYTHLQGQLTPWSAASVGFILGLATLTRAVFLLFPCGLVVHLLLVQRERWLRLSSALVVSYCALVSTWTIYNLVEWDRFIIAGEGLMSFLHQGAEGKASPREADIALDISPEDDAEDRVNAIKTKLKDTITNDPLGWVGHRVEELTSAYLQPHNTVYFRSESIKDNVEDWWQDDRSPGGLIDITHSEAFWPKLALYGFHFAGLILGGVGMVLARREWRMLLPYYGLVLYFTGIHLILLALPRYLFPMVPVWWIFATFALMHIWRWQHDKRQATVDDPPGTTTPALHKMQE
ncbi:MAG: phospholipid carrier-dependent glycosyltransferase [Chloroflexi bacterium]|nr:phospholipid carrier-dependent glycosyltransferase [Chloroflexota bacterium]